MFGGLSARSESMFGGLSARSEKDGFLNNFLYLLYIATQGPDFMISEK